MSQDLFTIEMPSRSTGNPNLTVCREAQIEARGKMLPARLILDDTCAPESGYIRCGCERLLVIESGSGNLCVLSAESERTQERLEPGAILRIPQGTAYRLESLKLAGDGKLSVLTIVPPEWDDTRNQTLDENGQTHS